jgi:hypothetical protein
VDIMIVEDGVTATDETDGEEAVGVLSDRARGALAGATAPADHTHAAAEEHVSMADTPPAPVAPPVEAALQVGPWQLVHGAFVGTSHLQRAIACQDATGAVAHPRLVLVATDGAGSSSASDWGAQAVVAGVIRLVHTLDRHFAALLDQEIATPQGARDWALTVVKHAHGLLEDLSVTTRMGVRDLRSTLLAFVAGTTQCLWLKVGDGAIVCETWDDVAQAWQCRTLGSMGKGEYANETVFLDAVRPEDVQWGLIPAAKLGGVALMSDGAAERLVANDGSRVADRMSTLFGALREQQLSAADLARLFYSEEFCRQMSGDDRCLAMASRQYEWVSDSKSPAPIQTGVVSNAQVTAVSRSTQPAGADRAAPRKKWKRR